MNLKKVLRGKKSYQKLLDAFEKGDVTVSVSPLFGGVRVSNLFVAPELRGKGIASSLLELIKENSRGPVWIKPGPFGDMPLTTQQLTTFYEKLGFKKVDNRDNMVYRKNST